MLEPYEGKLSRTVLRGERSRNTPDLPAQILENKQRFISQIMTSKTPVRSADDIDEATQINGTLPERKNEIKGNFVR